MITPDDNGYGRVKKWREKNRARYNLYQRNYRKGITAASSKAEEPHGPGREDVGSTPTPQTFTTKKVGELNMIVLPEEKVEETPMKPVIFRNDQGVPIPEGAWKKLQELKRRAKEGGYTLDEYSQ